MRVDIPPPHSLVLEQGSLTQDMTTTLKNKSISNSSAKEDSLTCLIDFCEWWCYKTITSASASASAGTSDAPAAATATSKSTSCKEYFDETVKACENLFSTTVEKPAFGRLCNRLVLASLSVDVVKLTSTAGSGSGSGTDWMALKEELILTKNKLLRQDANRDILLLSETDQLNLLDASPSLEREHHPLFQSHYRHVLRRVLVQYHLTVFQASLMQSQGQKKLVRQAIDRYERHINQLFTQTTHSQTTHSQPTQDQDQEQQSQSQTESHNVRALPPELVGFLLKDLYHPNDSDLATRLIQHVQSLQSGNDMYSVKATQLALTQLFAAWQDLLLEEPTLVQLGYGEHLDLTSQPEEDAMLRRLSSCTGGVQPMENVSDFGDTDDDNDDDDDDDDEQTNNNTRNEQQEEVQPPAQKRLRLLTWGSSDDEQEQQQDLVLHPPNMPVVDPTDSSNNHHQMSETVS